MDHFRDESVRWPLVYVIAHQTHIREALRDNELVCYLCTFSQVSRESKTVLMQNFSPKQVVCKSPDLHLPKIASLTGPSAPRQLLCTWRAAAALVTFNILRNAI